jgi:hypothetical protein
MDKTIGKKVSQKNQRKVNYSLLKLPMGKGLQKHGILPAWLTE